MVLDAAPDRLSTATRCIGTLRSGAAADKVRPDARAKRAWLSSSMLHPKQPELPSWIGPAACCEGSPQQSSKALESAFLNAHPTPSKESMPARKCMFFPKWQYTILKSMH